MNGVEMFSGPGKKGGKKNETESFVRLLAWHFRKSQAQI